MEAYNKLGFYLSGGDVPTGLTRWIQRLDKASIPFFLTVDAANPALEQAQDLAEANPEVFHTIVYRSLAGPVEPDYRSSPEQAAEAFWEHHRRTLPASLNADTTWLEPMEIRQTDGRRGDWLGAFAYQLGQMMLSEGYKLAAFSFPVGTPSPKLWEREQILRFLALCQRHPNRLAIALQEFSRQVGQIWFMRNDYIGRFFNLYAATDRAQLKRPTVLITRWGWTQDRIPRGIDSALDDIGEVAELYARYPQVRGAAIWRLGPTGEGLERQVGRLIEPLTKFTLNRRYDVSGPESTDSPPGDGGGLEIAPRANTRFVSDVTVPDDSRIVTGLTFTKIWRVENSGNTDWSEGYRLVHHGGDLLEANDSHPLPLLATGEMAEISVKMKAPELPGMAFSDWRCQTDLGEAFGDVIYVRFEAVAEPYHSGGVADSRFIADVTYPDDTAVAPGATFTKTWRMVNSGSLAWDEDFTIEFVGGNNLAAEKSYHLTPTSSGDEVDISIEMTAPEQSGVYYADWRLKDADGRPFGEMVYVRIVVPRPPGQSHTPPISQRDPIWAEKQLGQAGSPKTLGEWGCLLTCLAMVANTLGRETDPARLNDAMLSRDGFLDLYLTKWNALSHVYRDIVYQGRFTDSPDLLTRIDASLARGIPVPVQVDMTRHTPYSDFDQHWVLIIGRDGDDYRINDPWLLPAQEASLMERYGRTEANPRQAIISALFYRSTSEIVVDEPDDKPEPTQTVNVLERGMNVNPDAPFSNPFDNNELKGLEWVRFVFKLAARPNPAERDNLAMAFAQYDPIIKRYNQMGVKCLVVLNQETWWGNGPWTGNNDWQTYAQEFARLCGEVAGHYRRHGDNVAYQIWNEGDKKHNPASVYVTPEQYAVVLRESAAAVRSAAPGSPIIFNGMATGPEATVAYVQRCQNELGGRLPVDAVGIHPYTRWATRAPFDWGGQYGTLGEAFAIYERELPGLKFWITELGVADDNEIGSQYYAEIADYLQDVVDHLERHHSALVPVIIWFAWSDWMRNAGIVHRDGARKDHVYAAFRAIRNREKD